MMTNNQTQPISLINIFYNGKDITDKCFIHEETGIVLLPTVRHLRSIGYDLHKNPIYEENKSKSVNYARQFLEDMYYNTLTTYVSDKAFKKELEGEEAKQVFQVAYDSFKNKVQKNIDCKKDWERPLSRLKNIPAKIIK